MTTVNGCDSVVTLNLTVLPEVPETVESDTICYGETYTWNGVAYTATGDYVDTLANVHGCDSVVTLHLTVLPEVTLPAEADVAVGIDVICGNAIDVTEAAAAIQAHVTADPAAPAFEKIVWEVKQADGTWTPLTTDALDGNVTSVTLRYTVYTACEDVISNEITLTVEIPTPENDTEMTNIPAYNNYGGRLLTVDIKQIKADFGWDVAAEDVTWYMRAEGGNDQKLGTGFYWAKADGTPLEAGQYYARINHIATEASDCDGILQTVDVVVATTAEAPKLVPTVARPNELIQVLNLNADAVSTISVYSTTGELMHTFQVANQENATFPAAQLTGYYVVEVLTETEKVSLRYIVK